MDRTTLISNPGSATAAHLGGSSSRFGKDGHIFSKLILKFNQRDFFVAGDMLIEKGGYEDFVNLEKCRLNL